MEEEKKTTTVKAGVKPRSKTDGRGPKPSDYKEGAYVALIDKTTVAIDNRYNEFSGSSRGLAQVGAAIGRHLIDLNDSLYSGVEAAGDLIDSATRMINISYAKKLAYSTDPESSVVHSNDLGPWRKMEIQMPLPIKVAVDGFGFFQHQGARYRMRNAPFNAFNAFAHAVGDAGVLGLPVNFNDNDVVYNRRMVGSRQACFDDSRFEYNSFAKTADINLVMGGLTIKPPRVMAGFQALIGAFPAGNQPPESIQRAIQIAAALEQNLGNHAYPNQNEAVALRALGVIFVDWSKEQQDELITRYKSVHETRIATKLKHLCAVETVRVMTAEGRPFQLMDSRIRNGTVFTHPFDLPERDVEFGIISGNEANYSIDVEQMETASAVSRLVAIDRFVRSHMKGPHIV